MNKIYTEDDTAVILEFFNNGAHLIPFEVRPTGGKKPAEEFYYKKRGDKLESVAETLCYINEGYYIALLPVISNMLAVDVDVPMQLTDADMTANGFNWRTKRDYFKFKKQEWKSLCTANPELAPNYMETFANHARRNDVMPTAYALSSSGRSFHFYYKLKGALPESQLKSNTCIEIKCANYNVIIPRHWHVLKDWHNSDTTAYTLKQLTDYWYPTIDKFINLSRPAPPPFDPGIASNGRFDPDTMEMDYDLWAENSEFANQGRNSTLYVKAQMALRLDDHDGLERVKQQASMEGLSQWEIERTVSSAMSRASGDFVIPFRFIKNKE